MNRVDRIMLFAALIGAPFLWFLSPPLPPLEEDFSTKSNDLWILDNRPSRKDLQKQATGLAHAPGLGYVEKKEEPPAGKKADSIIFYGSYESAAGLTALLEYNGQMSLRQQGDALAPGIQVLSVDINTVTLGFTDQPEKKILLYQESL